MMYYHVIEDGGYDRIASHGWYRDYNEACAKMDALQSTYPELHFYVYTSNSRREPEFVTL